MEDKAIVELFRQRDENAIEETAAKYGKMLFRGALRILGSAEDAEECVSDTYHDAWRSIPPHSPEHLPAYLMKLCRRISLDLWRKQRAQKRGGGETALALEELEECLPDGGGVVEELERRELREILNEFLAALPEESRSLFLRRYWFMEPVADLARAFGFSESKTASMLRRIRQKLRARMEKEGYYR